MNPRIDADPEQWLRYFYTELQQIHVHLGRIADVLERQHPPKSATRGAPPADARALTRPSLADQRRWEDEDQRPDWI